MPHFLAKLKIYRNKTRTRFVVPDAYPLARIRLKNSAHLRRDFVESNTAELRQVLKTQDRVVRSPAALYVFGKRQIRVPNELGQGRDFAKDLALLCGSFPSAASASMLRALLRACRP